MMIGFDQTTNKLKFDFDGSALTKGKTDGLQFNGRAIMGKLPARDQELLDHYMAPLTTHTPALECMKEIQHEAFLMGIPLNTRHREGALPKIEPGT